MERTLGRQVRTSKRAQRIQEARAFVSAQGQLKVPVERTKVNQLSALSFQPEFQREKEDRAVNNIKEVAMNTSSSPDVEDLREWLGLYSASAKF